MAAKNAREGVPVYEHAGARSLRGMSENVLRMRQCPWC